MFFNSGSSNILFYIVYRFDDISGFPAAEISEMSISAARWCAGPEMMSTFDFLTPICFKLAFGTFRVEVCTDRAAHGPGRAWFLPPKKRAGLGRAGPGRAGPGRGRAGPGLTLQA
jgi:hypothetical protein